jgi:ATP-dependent helicase/nuclease subunit A
VLTERYLSYLRDGSAEVGQIVAITFTERAARQMRGRIRREVLGQLRAADGDEEAAQWSKHLRDLETAPISTIHAFCGTLLRQHAVVAGLDTRFEVLEDVLVVNLEAEALNLCLQRLLTDRSETGAALARLVLLHGWRPVVEGVRRLMQAWDDLAWRQWLDRPVAEIIALWHEQARTVLPRYLRHFLALRPSFHRCLSLLQNEPDVPEKMADRVRVLRELLPRLADEADLPSAIDRLLAAARVQGVTKRQWADEGLYQEMRDTFTQLRADLAKLGTPLAEEGLIEEAVEVSRSFLRVAGEAAGAYRERKRLQGVVDFQDLLVMTRDLLRDHADVRRRVQDHYRVLLIDELQDTDPVQMEVVDYLCGAEMHRGKLFAVGDAQQSIYRFRGADVALFRRLRDNIAVEGRQALTVNFRSQPGILAFVNALSADCLPEYDELAAYRRQITAGPCVEFLWTPVEEVARDEARAREADRIAGRIAAMIDRESLVTGRFGERPVARPVRPRDVVLLFRAMTNVQLYEAALRRRGLDYYLVGGRAFFAQQEIYDVLNLLRALENPQDGVSLAGTLRAPFCCVSDEALYVLGRHPDGLWAGLLNENEVGLPTDQREPVGRARHHLRRWRSLKDRMPIAHLLNAVLADSGYDAAVRLEHLGDRKLANLWKLLDLARTFDRFGLLGLADFIARLGDLVRHQPREEQAATLPENADVVRLMSIHQAKGLEFPVVIVPDLAGETGPAQRPVAEWHPVLGCVARPPLEEKKPLYPDFGWRLWEMNAALDDWEEDLRTLYVACTRAEDYLVLSAALPSAVFQRDDARAANAWMFSLGHRFDLSTGRCLDEALAAKYQPRVRVSMASGEPPVVQAHQRPDARRPLLATGNAAAIQPFAPVLHARDTIAVSVLLDLPRRRDTRRGVVDQPFDEEGGCDPNDGSHQPFQALPAEVAAAVRAARSSRQDVEFLLDLGDGPEELPRLHGRITAVWEDTTGQWHVLCRVDEASTADDPAPALAAEAVRRQTGAWPRTITLLTRQGECIRREGDAAVLEKAIEAIRAMLREAMGSTPDLVAARPEAEETAKASPIHCPDDRGIDPQ